MKKLTVMAPKGASLKMALQPCPFCGGEAKLFYSCLTLPYVCSCLSCRAEGPCSEKDVGAVELWNRRCEMPNTPLTLEELREMDGEPVWIVGINDSHIEDGWALVHREWCGCKTWGGWAVFFERYGEWWLAYRRKPEEG